MNITNLDKWEDNPVADEYVKHYKTLYETYKTHFLDISEYSECELFNCLLDYERSSTNKIYEPIYNTNHISIYEVTNWFDPLELGLFQKQKNDAFNYALYQMYFKRFKMLIILKKEKCENDDNAVRLILKSKRNEDWSMTNLTHKDCTDIYPKTLEKEYIYDLTNEDRAFINLYFNIHIWSKP